MPNDALERARAAFAQMAWADAYALFVVADNAEPLRHRDLEATARAAQLLGRESDADTMWQRAVNDYERDGDNEHAAEAAYWLGMSLMHRGEMAQAGGWFARARRLLDDCSDENAVAGYLLIPEALRALFGGDAETAQPIFAEVVAIGTRFGDVDVVTLGRMGLGQALLSLGRSAAGVTLLDDAMTAVVAGEVSPLVAGIVYCAVIEACHQLFDLRRAREWTEALSRWCNEQPDLVPFRGQCLTHRAEIMKLRGAWSDALVEVQHACDRLMQPPPQPAIADALYQKAEIHRLRGEFVDAEEAYRAASQWGREPQPGLAQMRLAQGDPAAAEAAIRRVVAENHDLMARARLLAAFVEIMLAVEDVPAARSAAEELTDIAAATRAPYLDATSAYATGAVALADGDGAAAISALRRACALYCELDTPYEAARARVLIGSVCREVGDDDTATMEFDIARRCFTEVGALSDLAALDALTSPISPAGAPSGLTGREVEVLELIARGKTNRQIAQALYISEKTVARHVSNIFTKLTVQSRAAATAYAYEHGLA